MFDWSEAPTLRRVFDLYESGLNGRETGHKEIAADLKHRGSLLRSTKDSRNRVRRRIRIQPRARRTWNGTPMGVPQQCAICVNCGLEQTKFANH